ncbi:hypothetical protein D9M68_89160 [compost metagenome]
MLLLMLRGKVLQGQIHGLNRLSSITWKLRPIVLDSLLKPIPIKRRRLGFLRFCQRCPVS